MLDKVIDVVEIWYLEENKNGFINLFASLRGALAISGYCSDGEWYWCNRTELEDLFYDLYSIGFHYYWNRVEKYGVPLILLNSPIY